jgi:hypothetical protein
MQRPSMLKRQKERQRMERRQEKAAEKGARREEKKARGDRAAETGEDPDIAGIVPGPQPLPAD